MKLKFISIVTIAAVAFSGCMTSSQGLVKDNSYSRTQNGSLIGGLIGAAIGATKSKNHKFRSALLGGAAGAAVGAGAGYLLDQQANEIANALGTGVSNDPLAALNPNRSIIVTKGENYVKVMFRDSMMFAVNSDRLQPSARSKVIKIGQLLKRYPQTTAQVAGFTDSTGSYQYNYSLSKSRATTVANVIRRYGVKNDIYAKGCSYNKPLVPNKSAAQKALNRRVEIYLYNNSSDAINPCRAN